MFNGAGLAFISSSVVLVINSLIPGASSSVWKHADQPHGSVATVLAQTLNFELRSALKSCLILSHSLSIKPRCCLVLTKTCTDGIEHCFL